MILEIVKYPDPVLRMKGKPVGAVTPTRSASSPQT